MNFSRFSSNKATHLDQEVGEHTLRFYQNRIGLLADLAEVTKPIVGALTTLFDRAPSDTGCTTERYNQGTQDAMERIIVDAITPEMAAFRATQKREAVQAIIDTFMGARQRLLLGRVLMDSLRDEFPYKKDRTTAEIEAFLYGNAEGYDGLETTTLIALVTGWAKANGNAFGKLFGDMGEKVVGLVRGKMDALRLVTDPTSGDDSKTASPEPSTSDTPPSTSSN